MSPSAYIARIALSLLLIIAAGTANAASNANALLGATEPVVLDLDAAPTAAQHRPNLGSGAVVINPTANNRITTQRLPSQTNRGFDWSTLISLSFGILGLLWVRRRSAAL